MKYQYKRKIELNSGLIFEYISKISKMIHSIYPPNERKKMIAIPGNVAKKITKIMNIKIRVNVESPSNF